MQSLYYICKKILIDFMKANDWYSMTDTEIIVEIGQRIKVIRIAGNLTQQKLADNTGLNRSTIRDIENGKSVNLLSIIPVLRELNILHNLDESIPNYESSPVLAQTHKNRKRVKLSAKEKTILQ
jgi:transcriptional regulator with XRE-family HTH domain